MAEEPITPTVPEPVETPPVAEPPAQERSTTIPRPRFDQVVEKNKDLEAKIQEMEQQQAYQQYQQPGQVDLFSTPQPVQPGYQNYVPQQNSYAQPTVQQQPVQVDPNDQKAQSLGYQNWNQWAATDMNSALNSRRETERFQQNAGNFLSQRDRLEADLAAEKIKVNPEYADKNKLFRDPEVQEYLKLCREDTNGYNSGNINTIRDKVKLAKFNVAQRYTTQAAQQQQQQGAQAEQARSAQASAATVVIGNGTANNPVAPQTDIVLTPAEDAYRQKRGMSKEDWVKNRDATNASMAAPGKTILRKEERAKRPTG